MSIGGGQSGEMDPSVTYVEAEVVTDDDLGLVREPIDSEGRNVLGAKGFKIAGKFCTWTESVRLNSANGVDSNEEAIAVDVTPADIEGGLQVLLKENDFETLDYVFKFVKAAVFEVFGKNVFEQIEGGVLAGDETVKGLMNEKLESVVKFVRREMVNVLSQVALARNAEKALKHKAYKLEGQTRDLAEALGVANNRVEGLLGEVRRLETVAERVDKLVDMYDALVREYITRMKRGLRDSLTGAMVKNAFIIDAYEALRDATPENPVYILKLDLDKFKLVNDTSTDLHETGDQVLKAFVDVIKSVLGDRGDIYRVGGEEFGIVIHGLKDGESFEELAQEMHDSVYERVFWYQDPERAKLSYRAKLKTKELWNKLVSQFYKPAENRVPKVNGRIPKLIEFNNDGIELEEIEEREPVSFVGLSTSMAGATLKRVTFSCGAMKCPADNPELIPKTADDETLRDKVDDLRETVKGTNLNLEEIPGFGKVRENPKFVDLVNAEVEDGHLAQLAVMLGHVERASYEAKSEGRNATWVVDGKGGVYVDKKGQESGSRAYMPPRNGRCLTRCEEAGDIGLTVLEKVGRGARSAKQLIFG